VRARIVTRLAPLALVLALGLATAPAALAMKIEEVKSPGGITAWLVEDHTVPVVSASIGFRGGAALDPDDKAGLASLTSALLDEGAGDLDSTAFQTKIEDLAATIGFDAGQDLMTARLRSLTANVDPVFDLLHLALTAPRFDEAPVARIRAETLDLLARDKRQPNAIASRLWWQKAFDGHPYARSSRGTPEAIERITADDMRGLVRARFAKDVLLVSVVGDITPATLAPLLDRTFGALPEHAAPDTLSDVTVHHSNDTMVVNLPVPQSFVVFGQQGLKRNDPDWYGALVVLDILATGGLTSRLALEVREQRGLAYSISASLVPLQHSGLILGQVGSQNARVAQAIDLIRGEWRRMHDDGPTAKELADAKTYLTGSFPLSLDSTGRIAATMLSIQLDRLGIDYLDRRNALIEKVSMADAKRIAKRLLDPDDLFFVVVGSPENLSAARRVLPGG
jgi:zinc protease